MKTNFLIEKKFLDYFKKLNQVYFFLTNRCNLNCIQCFYKLDTHFNINKTEIDFKDAIKLIKDFKTMGASKLTLLGGEPTLYDNKRLLEIIKYSKKIGYKYIKIDTNGIFNKNILYKPDFHLLNEISFSLDGPSPSVNDKVRGKNSFKACVKNIKEAIKLGYNVNITCCVHKGLLSNSGKKSFLVNKMILFAQNLGVNEINFHIIFKSGVPRDYYIGNIDIGIKDWIEIFNEIKNNIDTNKYKIPIRIPTSFIEKKEFDKNPDYYGYCSAKQGDRLSIEPNGMIGICSLLVGTPYSVARFYEDKIVWDSSDTNELKGHCLNKKTPCTNQTKCNKFGEYIPLCVSFKPKQEEFIWKQITKWDKKSKK